MIVFNEVHGQGARTSYHGGRPCPWFAKVVKKCEGVKRKLLKYLSPDLNIFTAVRMARRDLDAGNINTAILRLIGEADKICFNKPGFLKFLVQARADLRQVKK